MKEGCVRCQLWARQTCSAFTSTSKFNLAIYKHRRSLFFLVTCIFAFLSFPGLSDGGIGGENPKSPRNSISTPFWRVQSYRWILCSNSIMKIRLPSQTGLSPSPPQCPASWCSWFSCTQSCGGNGHLLEGKRSKLLFQVSCPSNSYHWTHILFYLIFIIKVNWIFQVGQPICSLESCCHFSSNLCLYITTVPPPLITTIRITVAPQRVHSRKEPAWARSHLTACFQRWSQAARS